MIRSILLAAVVLTVFAGPAQAVELDLFVTDYNENPSPEQTPMATRAISYPNAEEVMVKVGGRTVTHKAPTSVAVIPAPKGKMSARPRCSHRWASTSRLAFCSGSRRVLRTS